MEGRPRLAEGWLTGYAPPPLLALQTVQNASLVQQDGKLVMQFTKVSTRNEKVSWSWLNFSKKICKSLHFRTLSCRARREFT